MINSVAMGNLGNQFFTYAYARKIQHELQQDINIYKFEIERLHYKFDLDCFYLNEHVNIQEIPMKDEKIVKLLLFFNRITRYSTSLNYIYNRFIRNVFSHLGIQFWMKETYEHFKIDGSHDNTLVGYWQCPQYFDDIREILIQEFQPIFPPMEKNFELYKIIENNESICVSVRRGDYTSNPKIRKKYMVTDENFFVDGVKKIRSVHPRAPIICFSDDIDWVRNNIDFNGDVYYEDGDDPIWEKMRMMTKCKHFVISNSTFSWWAQYLSENPQKIIYAPFKWYADGRKADIYQENWNLIKANGVNT
ncbi:alpha-1,2-fucosyltransferase [Enterococcus sp. AZ196]|uniref:alpha-1,2-fucosyltransferase n=1 Tax=Enterococcus sp. AZ196 TaxID=2774659 RepID=UPI003D2D3725